MALETPMDRILWLVMTVIGEVSCLSFGSLALLSFSQTKYRLLCSSGHLKFAALRYLQPCYLQLIKASGLFDTNSVKLNPPFSNVDFTFRTETSAMSIDSKE